MSAPASLIPIGIPRALVAGDSSAWEDGDITDPRLGLFSIRDGWTLTYYFAGTSSNGEKAATANADGTRWLTSLSDQFTADLKDATIQEPEQLSWFSAVDNGTNRYTVRSGKLWLHPDPATLVGAESHVDKMIRLIKAELESRATGGGFVNSYTMPDGVSMNLVTTTQLEGMLGRYLAKRDTLQSGQMGRGVEAHLGRAQ